MTDHRTTAENDLARAVHAVADALAKYARDCPTPDCLLAAGHAGNHDTTDLPDTGSTYVDVMFDGPPGPESGRFIEVENQHRASIRFGEWVEFADGRWALRIRRRDVERIEPDVIDHAVLQQNLDRARAAFPGTYSRPTAPRICERRWSEMSGAHHECVLLAGHDTDRHQCECGAGCYDDDDEGSSVCPADGCGRPDGHDGDHLAAGPLTLPTLTVKRGGIRYDQVVTNTPDPRRFIHHTSEGGDTSALATDVPDGSHEHGSTPAPDRLPPIVRSARTCADLTTNPRFAEVFMTCADVIEGMHRDATGQRVLMDSYERQIREISGQRDRADETRAKAQGHAHNLAQAIVHTVDYVGNDMLPAVEGWSWYDALREFWPEMANRFVTNPVRPKAQQ